jgi:hypothetical protein
MTRIVIDEATKEKLQALKSPAVLIDSEGHVVARVTPVYDPALYEGMDCPLSPEEIAERHKNPGKLYTSEEVRAMLEKR